MRSIKIRALMLLLLLAAYATHKTQTETKALTEAVQAK